MSIALWTPLSIMRSQSDAGFFQLDGAQQIAGLDDDLERIAELVGELANLNREIFGNRVCDRSADGVRRAFWIGSYPWEKRRLKCVDALYRH